MTRSQIIERHFKIYERPLVSWKLDKEFCPMWESAGLIYQEPDPNDKRVKLIYPTSHFPLSQDESNRNNTVGDEKTEWEKEDQNDIEWAE